MRVLLLSPYPDAIAATLAAAGDEIVAQSEQIDRAWCRREGIEFIVSYGYRFLIGKPVLSDYPGRAVNLHVSYLPWNRGADPNLWSWVEGTPKGVTIHLLDEGIDTGAILVQEETAFDDGETLASSYGKLRSQIESLFARSWPKIRLGPLNPRPQAPGGSFHRIAEGREILRGLALGYATPVADLARSPGK